MRRFILAALLLLAGGCAYYNGMYNTKQLAGRARKAEREGRVYDAQGLWGQVAIKAESVVVRHPAKSWSDEARLLHGTALVRVNDCERALQPLEAVMLTSRHRDLAEEATLLVGGCRLKQGDPAGATAAYARLLHSREPDRRSLALLEHGRTLRIGGRLEEALAELKESRHPRAHGELAATLAALGRTSEVLALVDSLLAGHDSTAPWRELLAALAVRDPEAAAALTDRMAADGNLPAALRSKLLLEDGLRWLASDTSRSERRFQEAQRTGKATPVQAEVRYQRAQALIGRSATLMELRMAADRLEEVAEEPGAYDAGAARLGAAARRVLVIGDSVVSRTADGDLRIFLAAEIARDSLGAGPLAGSLFGRVAADWPDSPFAPKAILALIELDTAGTDSLRAALLARYPESPYVTMAQGSDAPAYRVLEDSLRRFVDGIRPALRSPPSRPVQPGRPQPQQPTPSRQPADN